MLNSRKIATYIGFCFMASCAFYFLIEKSFFSAIFFGAVMSYIFAERLLFTLLRCNTPKSHAKTQKDHKPLNEEKI